jgi:hypothetical protein
MGMLNSVTSCFSLKKKLAQLLGHIDCNFTCSYKYGNNFYEQKLINYDMYCCIHYIVNAVVNQDSKF